MKTVPVLDREHLLEMTDGDVEFERELLSTYRTSAISILARLRTGLSAGDLPRILRDAHALKGSSLNVGAVAMGQCAGAIEMAARDGDLARATQAAQELDAQEAALWSELGRM